MVKIEYTIFGNLAPINRVLGYQQTQAVMFEGFQADVLSLIKQLEITQNARWLLCFEDSYQFAVAFYAVLYAGRVPVLLPNNKETTISELKKNGDGILSDLSQIVSTPLKHQDEVMMRSTTSMDASQKIIIFTSGSTGQYKQVERTVAELNQEILALEAAFGEQLGDLIVATVSHQHIYGLLFCILWPISSKRMIHFSRCEYPERIIKEISNTSNLVLVTSPTFVKRMRGLSIPLNNAVIFSSGGLVDYNDARALYDTVGSLPIEVLGSTETGGVAYRQQTMVNAAWKPFPAVEVRLDDKTQCITVNTPFAGNGSKLIMGDQAILNEDGTFRLLGRADRIAKIEGKRISLVQVEQSLIQHQFVAEARVVALVSAREYLAAAVVLNEEGMKQLEHSGKLAVNTILKKHLSDKYELTLLPKRFRYLKQIPHNQQGKIIQADIESLFANLSVKSPVIRSKVVLSEEEVEFQLVVPSEVEYFKGHFEGMPVLPGVAQTDWVAGFASEHFNIDKKTLKEITRVKFSKVILPNDSITLVMSLNRNKLTFKYLKNNSICSSGVILSGDQ